MVGRYGPFVPAAVAIAGQAPAKVQVNQRGMKLVAIQGELDTWPDTREFLASVTAAGGETIDISLPGKGHYISEEAIFHPAVIATLRSAGIEVTAHRDPH